MTKSEQQMKERGERVKRRSHLKGMDDVTRFLRANPSFPLPAGSGSYAVWCNSRGEFAQLARMLGHGEKGKGYTCIYLRKKFAGITKLDLCMSNETAQCRKVVTGTRRVEEQIIPAHTEETTEWVCDDAILKADDSE